MRIGSLMYTPYIYNTNMLSSNSLSKISPIGDDLTTAKTDYSSLTDGSLNINPLGKGESANFFDILGMQMQMSRLNASRVMAEDGMQTGAAGMQEATEADMLQAAEEAAEAAGTEQLGEEPLDVNEAAAPEEMAEDVAMMVDSAMDGAEMMEDFQPVHLTEEVLSMQYDRNLYQMQRAAEAYRVQML